MVVRFHFSLFMSLVKVILEMIHVIRLSNQTVLCMVLQNIQMKGKEMHFQFYTSVQINWNWERTI